MVLVTNEVGNGDVLKTVWRAIFVICRGRVNQRLQGSKYLGLAGVSGMVAPLSGAVLGHASRFLLWPLPVPPSRWPVTGFANIRVIVDVSLSAGFWGVSGLIFILLQPRVSRQRRCSYSGAGAADRGFFTDGRASYRQMACFFPASAAVGKCWRIAHSRLGTPCSGLALIFVGKAMGKNSAVEA
ncbi:hypothetical protein KCP71_16695 [Salmonella enterica subsp. enterica]|nr:hypothetical protein KCP71_16695 [Salmonella enterica subsp. enterica]